MDERFIKRVNIAVSLFFTLFFAVMVFNTFLRHITPDISVFLLHTRTFIEKGNRFISSFDNKGPLMTFILMPAVWLFGAKLTAAAFTQAIFYIVGIICIVIATKKFYGLYPALILAILCATFNYSAWLWGGNFRPEDLMFFILAVMLLVYEKKDFGKIYYLVAGLCISAAFFLKLSLMLAPLALTVAGAICELSKNENKLKIITQAFFYTTAGFLIMALPILVCLLIFDSVNGWVRQALLLPIESRAGSATSFKLKNFIELITATGFIYILFGALITSFFVLRAIPSFEKKTQNFIIILIVWMLTELLRVFAEGSPWPYLLLGAMPAALIISFLLASKAPQPYKKFASWLFPLILLSPLLSDAYAAEIRAFKLRFLEKGKAPYEELALIMNKEYQSGETLFVEDTDYQLFLLLNAPPPYPVLKRLFWFIRDEERKNFLSFYATNPPDWIIVKRSENSPIKFTIEGDVDFPYHIWHYAGIETNNAKSSLWSEGTELPASNISHFVQSQTLYQLRYDIGWAQAWKRQQ